MRYFKSFALMTALTLSGAAFATMPGVMSTNTDFNTATNQVTATGTYQSAVSFTVPSAHLTIPSDQARPGAHFTVTIPVFNTTDRAITISDNGSSALAGNVIVTPISGPRNVMSGSSDEMVYDLTFPANGADAEMYDNQAVEIVFNLLGVDAPTEEQNLTVQPEELP